MFTIKQRIIDPVRGSVNYIQVVLNLEERRMDSILREPILIAHSNQKSGEESSYLNVEEHLINLLDAKRTSAPYNCFQTYLTQEYNGGLELNIFNANHLNTFKNCPIAVLSDLNGSNIDYAMIKDFAENKIILSNELNNKYKPGAFVQNLSNRWWKYPLSNDQIGIKSKYSRPSSVNFSIKSENGIIKFLLHDVINKGIIQVYDLYVKDRKFEKLECHWIPEISDIPIDNTELEIKDLEIGKEYWVGVVTKDKMGRVDVNESVPVIQMIKVE